VKFLVDMPLSPALARWLQTRGHDAKHVVDVGMSRDPDSEIMALALAEARTVVTADLDYPRLLALTGADGPSLMLFRGGDWSESEIIACFATVLDQFDEQEIAGSILVIDRNRVRRRRLPIDRSRESGNP
jgi:predicted nuclease of predicted toxin-antitoxin system